MKNPWIIIGVLMVVLIGGAVWYSSTVSQSYNEGVEIKANIKGNQNAVVTLTEYSDFECPACAQFQPMVNEILAQYGDSIKFEYKHYPLIQIHKYAQIAAQAAEAAGQQGKFFEFADKLFENQAVWAKSGNPTVHFTQYATELGLDVDKFNKQQRAPMIQDKVKSEMMEARGLGLTGTPSFFLNGTQMKITSYEDFVAQIEAAIKPQVDFSLPGTPLEVIPVSDTNASATPVASGTVSQ